MRLYDGYGALRYTAATADAQQHASGGAVPIATLLARYERFRNDAGTAGLLTASNNQLFDVPGRAQSPYRLLR